MFAILDSEWGIIAVVVCLVVLFGGSKLPKLFHSLGSAQAEYKKGLAEGQPASPPAAAPPAVTPASTVDVPGAPANGANGNAVPVVEQPPATSN